MRTLRAGITVTALFVALVQVPSSVAADPSDDNGLFPPDTPTPDVSAAATLEEPGFNLSTVWSGFDLPTATRFASDGRVFVAEKSGKIKAFSSVNDSSATVVTDLSSKVNNYWDRGLLGLAVDPDWPSSNYIYVLYAWDDGNVWNDSCPNPPGATTDGCVVDGRLSRLRVNTSNNKLIGSEDVLLQGKWCSQYPSHSIGDLVFDRTGALIVTAGDGASFTFRDYGQGGGSPGSPTPVNPCNDPDFTLPDAEGGALRSQDVLTSGDPLSYDGAVLRLNKTNGAAASGNPWIGQGTADDDRIIAHGLRNPFRSAVRPGTDEVWITEVGWRDWEEINVVDDINDSVVENFGWPCYEGTGRSDYDGLNIDICEDLYDGNFDTDLTNPWYTYEHGDPPDSDGCPGLGASATGAAFYQGGPYPAQYDGALFFGDYAYKCIWVMFEGSNGQPNRSSVRTFISGIGVVDITVGTGGDLFITDIDEERVLRVRSNSSGGPPECNSDLDGEAEDGDINGSFQVGFDAAASGGAYVHQTSGSAESPGSNNVMVCFDVDEAGDYRIGARAYAADSGSDSFWVTVDGTQVANWDIPNNTSYNFSEVTDVSSGVVEVFLNPGEHDIGFHLRESGARLDTVELLLQPPGDPPTATITSPSSSLKWDVGDDISFSGTAVDPEDGTLGASAMTWQFDLHHCASQNDCHVHPLETRTGVSSGTISAPDHEAGSWLEITLEAEDSDGEKGTDSVELQPNVTLLTFQSNPPGVSLSAGEASGPAPFTHEYLTNGLVDIVAPSSPKVGGTTYQFETWSDGGARSHTITTPQNDTTYYATYSGGSADLSCDFDGDGFEDTAIGVPNESIGSDSKAGAVNVVYGSSSGLDTPADQLWHQASSGVRGAAEPNDAFGSALACGDFNWDGFGDLAIGAPGEDIGSKNGAGGVNVLYGSSSGLTASGDDFWSQESSGISGTPEAGDAFGAALTSGDFNGDSFADLAVGVPGEAIGARADAGMAHVLFGGPKGLSGSGSDSLHQNTSGITGSSESDDEFALALTSGDIDDDGFDDLVVGVPGEDLSAQRDAGAIQVMFGSASGITAAGDEIWSQNDPTIIGLAERNDQFGAALAAGDFDRDGHDDVAIGIPGEDIGSLNSAGAVAVLFGGNGGLSGTDDQSFSQSTIDVGGDPEAGDEMGAALATGDVDDDGFDDLVAGVPGEAIGNVSDAGIVHLFLGGGGGLAASGSTIWHQNTSGIPGGAESGDRFGASLTMGDFDDDGHADVVSGAPGESIGSVAGAGSATVIYGTGAGLTSSGSWQIHQDESGIKGEAETGDAFGRHLPT